MTGRTTKGLPLFFRLLIAFLGITIAVSGALILVAYVFSKKAIEKRTREDIARQVAAIDNRFNTDYQLNLQRNLRELALAPLMDDYLSSPALEKPIIARKVERLFLRMVADFEGYRSIYFIDPLGAEKVGVVGGKRVRRLQDLRRDESGLNKSARAPSLQASLRLLDQLETQPPPAIRIAGPFTDEAGEAAFVAGISKLDYDTGEVGGVIVIHCSLEVFLAHLSRVKFSGADLISVLAPDGRILRKPRAGREDFDPAPYLPDEVLEELRLLNLDQGILALQDLFMVPDEPFVRIAVAMPTALLLEDIRPTIRFFSLVFGVSVVVVLLVALYLSRYLSTPIVELASATSRLAAGDLSTRVQVETAGEVQMLVDSFNRMVEELEKNAEALRESEARFRTLVEHAADAIYVAGADGKFVDVNQQACESLGYSREELLALKVPDVQQQLSLEQFGQQWKQMVPGVPITREGTHRRKDGTTFPVEVRIGLFERDGRPLHLALSRDVTERKQAEEARKAAEAELEIQRTRSVRADRLQSLGEMAAGIAHELNQPLVGVRGLAEHALISMERGWELTKDNLSDKLGRIVEQADRMVHIIEHVRMFAREAGKPEVAPMQVNDVVNSSMDMLGTQFRSHGIELALDLAEGLPSVLANAYSLEEVILNLLNNARDAVEERLEAAATVPGRVEMRTTRDGQDVQIEVQDNGAGIPLEVISKVFDPFFTTKDPDKGTGLGLAISRSIVEECGGTLQIHSAPGEGTTVAILLPAADKAPDSA